MSRKAAPQDRIAEIVKAAINVFRRKGFRQAQMSEIAAEARLASGTLYTYFASKVHRGDDLLRRLVTIEHHGIGHARDGQVGERLASRVAGDRHF
ncbi:MAG: helix-turn-helix transcriptional regulator, partial [Candidatus Lindowbacteria bacterium]|nr:helix-turn-helix transcriptional regulator [Candidatus Lindowbacteria bacterium]